MGYQRKFSGLLEALLGHMCSLLGLLLGCQLFLKDAYIVSYMLFSVYLIGSMASNLCGLDEDVITDFVAPRNLDIWFFGASVIARLVQSI